MFFRYSRIALAVLLGLVAPAAYGQAAPISFGKVAPHDLTAAGFAQDTGVAAVVLCDYGHTRFNLIDGSFRLVFDRIRRVKILSEQGYEHATVRIPLYHKDGNEERVSSIKAATYSLTGGKVVRTDLKSADVVRTELDANHLEKRFTLPAVQVGSVIEYSYTITSDFIFNLQNWTFQETIPVRRSEYRAQIPQFLKYAQQQQGYLPLTITEHTTSLSPLTMIGGTNSTRAGMMETQTITVDNYRWVGENLPAFRDEPFITAPHDYMAHIRFQLVGTHYPGEAFKDLAGSWGSVNRELLTSDHFGGLLGQTGSLTAELKALRTTTPDPQARAAAVVDVVRRAVAFDGDDRLYATGSLRHAIDQHKGNSSEINLLLVSALREADLPAHPVILSTRDHGCVLDDMPLLERFNFVLAVVTLPGKADVLLDATEGGTAFGMLPERCLNTRGRVIAEDAADQRWLTVVTPHHYVHYTAGKLTLDERGAIRGTLRHDFAGYANQQARQQAHELGDARFISQYSALGPELQVKEHHLNRPDDLAKAMTLELDLEADGEAQPAPLLYVRLKDLGGESENMFRQAERSFPVDMGAPYDETILLTLALPAGYQLDAAPATVNTRLPDDAAAFQYIVAPSADGLSVQIMSRLNLRKALYSADEYPALREIYARLVAKHAEPLVLKRKS